MYSNIQKAKVVVSHTVGGWKPLSVKIENASAHTIWQDIFKNYLKNIRKKSSRQCSSSWVHLTNPNKLQEECNASVDVEKLKLSTFAVLLENKFIYKHLANNDPSFGQLKQFVQQSYQLDGTLSSFVFLLLTFITALFLLELYQSTRSDLTLEGMYHTLMPALVIEENPSFSPEVHLSHFREFFSAIMGLSATATPISEAIFKLRSRTVELIAILQQQLPKFKDSFIKSSSFKNEGQRYKKMVKSLQTKYINEIVVDREHLKSLLVIFFKNVYPNGHEPDFNASNISQQNILPRGVPVLRAPDGALFECRPLASATVFIKAEPMEEPIESPLPVPPPRSSTKPLPPIPRRPSGGGNRPPPRRPPRPPKN